MSLAGVLLAALAKDPARVARFARCYVTHGANPRSASVITATVTEHRGALAAWRIAAVWAAVSMTSCATHHPILARMAELLRAATACLAKFAFAAYLSALAQARGSRAAGIVDGPVHKPIRFQLGCRVPTADHSAPIAPCHRGKVRGELAGYAYGDVDGAVAWRLQLTHVRLAEPTADERKRLQRLGQQTSHAASDSRATERERSDRWWKGKCDAVVDLGAVSNRDRRETRVCSQRHEADRGDACEAHQSELPKAPGSEAE